MRPHSQGRVSRQKLSSLEALIRIREDILEGKYLPGQRLTEASLAERYQVSRTPVREALLQLQAEGIVVIDPRRGAVVSSYSTNELEEIYGIRTALERYAARLAATRISEESVAKLVEICDSMETAAAEGEGNGTLRYLLGRNSEFHSLIWDAAGNTRLRTHLRLLSGLPIEYRLRYWRLLNARARAMFYHRELVVAFTRHDAPRADALMMCHIAVSSDVILRSEDDAEWGP